MDRNAAQEMNAAPEWAASDYGIAAASFFVGIYLVRWAENGCGGQAPPDSLTFALFPEERFRHVQIFRRGDFDVSRSPSTN